MPVDELAIVRAGRRPQAERAVDMDPGIGMPGTDELDGRPDRVEGAGVHVPRLEADDQRAGRGRQRQRQCVQAHPTLIVGVHGDHAGPAQAEVLQRHGDRRVRLGPDHDRDLRRTEQATLLHVPAGPLEDAVPGGGKAREVRHLAAGREADAGPLGQAKELHHP